MGTGAGRGDDNLSGIATSNQILLPLHLQRRLKMDGWENDGVTYLFRYVGDAISGG